MANDLYANGYNILPVLRRLLTSNHFYDLDDSTVTLEQAAYGGSTYTTQNWFQGTLNNSYYTDGTYNTQLTAWKYNTAVNKKITKTKLTSGVSTTISYTRSTLDGVCIDFKLSDYLVATQNAVTSFSALNDINVQNKNFDFNTVLVYYDVIDPVTKVLKAKNLYGVLFLNKIQSNGLEFEIPYLEVNPFCSAANPGHNLIVDCAGGCA